MIQTYDIVVFSTFHIGIKNLRHTVYNHRRKVCERIVVLLWIETPPIKKDV